MSKVSVKGVLIGGIVDIVASVGGSWCRRVYNNETGGTLKRHDLTAVCAPNRRDN
ncbi:MAG: hypothetical protein ACLPY1_01925 [Terracidiphilus sp.]